MEQVPQIYILNMRSDNNCGKNFREWYFFKLFMTTQDEVLNEDIIIDSVTWKQWIYQALKKSYGIFGTGIEYDILHEDKNFAYVKVNYFDKDQFSSAIATYISDKELVGSPLTVTILQETPKYTQLGITEDDRLWFERTGEEIDDDSRCN